MRRRWCRLPAIQESAPVSMCPLWTTQAYILYERSIYADQMHRGAAPNLSRRCKVSLCLCSAAVSLEHVLSCPLLKDFLVRVKQR